MDEPSAPKLLLIVEDEESVTKLLKESLSREGFSIAQASNAEEAMQSALEHTPDLILLDLLLPGVNGMQFLKKVREQPWGKDLPVIILTNVPANEAIMSGVVRTEPSYYIVKGDSSLEEIVTKVRTTLGMESNPA